MGSGLSHRLHSIAAYLDTIKPTITMVSVERLSGKVINRDIIVSGPSPTRI
jgi:hypothetical protein